MTNKSFLHILLPQMALAVLTTFASCSSEEQVEENKNTTPSTFTVTAYQGSDGSKQTSSRVGFDSQGVGFWQKGDVIGIWSKDEGKFKPFTIASGEGTGTATFSGEIVGELEYNAAAIYPYSEKDEFNEKEGYLNVDFPATYTYTSVDSLVSEKEGNSFNMPMYGLVSGTGTADRNISFNHLGGVLVLVFDKIPQEGTVTVTAGSAICGTAQITDNDTTSVKKLRFISSADSCKTVTFNYSGAEKMQQGVFYLPLIAGTYTLTVKIDGKNQTSDGTGEIQYVNTKTFNEFTLEQGHLKKRNITTDYDIYVNGHKFIDLGLESGLLWAETNVGATLPADYGNFYAWGETTPLTTGNPSWSSYKWGTENSFTKYNSTDGKTELELEDDAVYKNWGAPCRMPTYQECYDIMDERNTNTTMTWDNQQNTESSWESGITVKSQKNGMSIFVPTCGMYNSKGREYTTYITIWTKSLDENSLKQGRATEVYNHTSSHYGTYPVFGNQITTYRYFGMPVRAVVQP